MMRSRKHAVNRVLLAGLVLATACTTSFAGQTITVDSAGAIPTISQAARHAGPGDTVEIAPGTYHETVWLFRSGTKDRPISFIAKQPGTVILDGSGLKAVFSSNHGSISNITVKGITVHGCANPKADEEAAVTTGAGWRLEDVTVEAVDGVGLSVFRDDVQLLRVAVNHCGRAGLSGDGCSNVLLKDCVTVGNNTMKNDPDFDAGAGKFLRSDHVVVDGLVSHDNIGPGLWFDYENHNVEIRNCTIYDNKGLLHDYSGSGIRCELDPGPVLIEHNRFYGNTGPNIEVNSSRRFTIRDNTFRGSSITLKDWPRGDDYTLQDVTIEHNIFRGTHIATESDNWDLTSPEIKHISIDHDEFESDGKKHIFQWGKQLFMGLPEVRDKLGFEKNGTLRAPG